MTATTMNQLLGRLADTKAEAVQVKLKDFTPQPFGPGVIERVDGVEGAYRIVCEVMQHTVGQIGKVEKIMLMPFLFVADDVLWVSESPMPKPATSNGRSEGLIHTGS